VEAIKADALPIYMYGLMRYEDALRMPHVIRFCYRLRFKGGEESLSFQPEGGAAYWEYN
jgi:hypothetical protein